MSQNRNEFVMSAPLERSTAEGVAFGFACDNGVDRWRGGAVRLAMGMGIAMGIHMSINSSFHVIILMSLNSSCKNSYRYKFVLRIPWV